MPSLAHEAFSAVSSSVSVGDARGVLLVELQRRAAGMPAPQSPLAVPALMQVSVPLGTTFQPLSSSSALALAGLYGYGLVFSSVEAVRVRRHHRDRPVGRHGVALEDLLDVQRLVDQVLHGLPEVQLAEDLAGHAAVGGGVEVVREVVDGEGVQRVQVVGAGQPRVVRARLVRVGRPLRYRRCRGRSRR